MNSPREGWPEFLFSLGGKCFFPFRYRDGIFHDCVQFRVKHKWCSLNETYQGYWKYCSEEGEALAWKSRWWHWSWGSGLGVRENTRGFCKGNSQSIKLWNKGCTVLWRSEKSHCTKHLSASTMLPWKETFPQNLNPSPILFCMCLWWNRVEQMGVGTCVHAHTHVCVCVCVCDGRDKVQNKKGSYFDCFSLLCRLCKMCVSLLVQTPHLLGMYRGWGFVWESMVFTDPEL